MWPEKYTLQNTAQVVRYGRLRVSKSTHSACSGRVIRVQDDIVNEIYE